MKHKDLMRSSNAKITLNDKTVLSATNDHFYYLLPWTDSDTKETKLYHYNLEGGTSTWNVPDGFTGNLTMYELSDQGRGEAIAVPVFKRTDHA